MPQIFAFITHRDGVPDDSFGELLSAAKKIDAVATPTAIVIGEAVEPICTALRTSFSEVWRISNPELAHPNAELIRQALVKVLPANSILLLPHDHFGIDLAPGLSIKMHAACLADILSFEDVKGTTLTVVRQEFGGQVSTHVQCDISSGAVITIRPGAFKALPNIARNGSVVDKSSEIGTLTARRRYIETIVSESGDVDITKHDILVSVGRGIQEKDNLGIAEELADELGAAVSCSRPVVDAKWLEKSRQVGSSGKTVKPKVYLACGISGAFQHLAGIKGNPFIIAINKNPKAPIFQVADVGIVDDILEFLPELTSKIREMHSVSVK